MFILGIFSWWYGAGWKKVARILAQKLITADVNKPIMFDRDYTELYSLGVSSTDENKSGFYMTDLRLEQDK